MVRHRVPETLMELIIDSGELTIDSLRNRERIIERAEGVTGDMQVALLHLRTYLIRETRT